VQASGFSLEECDPKNMDRLWLQGGFPRAYLARPEAAWRWLDSFSQTLLERDIPQLGIRIPAETLRRFWLMLSHYHGQTWNAAEIGRSISCGPGATNHYRDLLAGSYMIRVLPPWFENLKKRQVKSPKIYLRDSGLLHRFLGVESMSDLRSHPRYGASWEGFALEQILIRFGDRDAYFWATQRGAELDLLLLRKGKRWGFEFKCTDAPSVSRAMHVALEDLGLEHLWVVYPGQDVFPMHPKITALPLSKLNEQEGLPLKLAGMIG
jgi:predicted AAA+ superfamily ATPase